MQYIKHTLQHFSQISGLTINYHKSSFQTSANINRNKKQKLAAILNLQLTNSMEKYLGVPIVAGRAKTECFDYAIQSLQK